MHFVLKVLTSAALRLPVTVALYCWSVVSRSAASDVVMCRYAAML